MNPSPLYISAPLASVKPMIEESRKPTKEHPLEKYLTASVAGAARGLFGLPIEHPFDTVKTRVQATPQPILALSKKILKEEGVRGFYSGAIPNGIRVAVKQFYRYPLMLGLPLAFESVIPKNIQGTYPPMVQVATGLTIASLEAGIICPLERMKIYLMTNHNPETKKITFFLKEHRGKMWAEVTRGLNAAYARQMMTWVSFLVADKQFKEMERKRTGKKELTFPSLIKVSFLVGGVNTLANMPFDTLKTHLQKENFIENKGVIQSMKTIYNKYGIKGLYTGSQIRMAQYMIQSVFTVTLLERLESSFRNK